ncbi:MAG: PASTA domain-containing protein [Eubacteriaceae bacterium]
MSDKKSFLESIAMDSEKPESFSEESFENVDPNITKKKYIGIGVALVVLIIAVSSIMYITSRVTVPDMTGWDINEAYEWAQKNSINLVINDIYDFDVEEDMLISQEEESDKKIKKNSSMTITVSLGPDGDESIEFPEIETMTASEIESWIEENKLSGAKIETEYSDLVEKDSVISYELLDGTEDDFKRKSRVTISISDGAEELSETVTVPDFSNGQVAQVITWGSENDVSINIEEVFDEYVNSGLVVYQSVTKETEMMRTDELTVKVSKGEAITVPNFTSMEKTQAEEWAKSNNVTLTIRERYSDSYNSGKIYSQSVSSGKKIVSGDEIVIYYSLGKVDVSSFIGKTKLDILQWRDAVNENHGSITVVFSEEYGESGTYGKIVEQSVYDEIVETGTTINVVISKGMKIVVPDLSSKTENEVNEIAKEMGLRCLFDYQYSELINPEDSTSDAVVEKGKVISQSISANTIISDNDKVTVVISLGKQ